MLRENLIPQNFDPNTALHNDRICVRAADTVSDNDRLRVEQEFANAEIPAFFTIRSIRKATAIDANHVSQAIESGNFARVTNLGNARRPVYAPIDQEPTTREKRVRIKKLLKGYF